MAAGRPITAETIEKIKRLDAHGVVQSAIAVRCGVTQPAVSKVLKQVRKGAQARKSQAHG
jgi:predicted transcriptional regulator